MRISAFAVFMLLGPAICDAGAGAVKIARTTALPDCTVFVDAGAPRGGNGSAQKPMTSIGTAIAIADPGAVICVAEGNYAEHLEPGEKYFTLAGGFQRGKDFKVRDSAAYVSTAKGKGGSFIRIEDPGPKDGQLVAIDGFEITGYSQAIYREYYESQRFDITNNYIHDNVCKDQTLVGAGFALNNVSGTIRGNVIAKNSCGRGGAGFLNDSKNENSVLIESNFIDANSGTEPDGSHGGALYLFGNKMKVVDNLFTNNTVTQWGGGLYIGAFKPGGQLTTAILSRNVYRGNRAGNKGGGFFCDDGASCTSDHEFFEKNCGDNVLLDSGPKGSGPTVAKFDFMTNADALTVDCSEPGIGVRMDRDDSGAADTYTFTNSTFRGNAKGGDLGTGCNSGCAPVKVTVTNSKVQREYVNGGIDIKFDAASGPALELPSSPASPIAAPASKIDAEIAKSPAKPASKEAYGPPDAADDGGAVDVAAPKPAVTRGAKYMGFAERFNRYYTDAAWKPAKTVYVSPDGSGDGANRMAPMAVASAISEARAGTKIHFLPGKYEGCFEFGKENSGTFDAPVVLYAERAGDQSTGVAMTCCKSGRKSCFNLEQADYVAVDGFEFIGGQYGVRAVGAGFPASEHSRGIAVLGCVGHDQDKDPFFSGQSDWNVWERNLAYGAKKGDGHGIYLSNGSDWNIVRLNSTYGNESSDFQINADPVSTCQEVDIPFDDPRCDAYAGEGEGGQGASDYFLVEGNYFHHSLGPGANFTSVRRSVVRNNIFGLHATKHNVSFWQETDNPKLGSSDNRILHNLFITTGRHGVQFSNNSTRNTFVNNVILGVTIAGGKVSANPSALLMEVDDTVGDNVYRSNIYISGKLEGRTPNKEETVREDFSASWFANFPALLNHDPNDFTPAADAPFLGMGKLTPDAPGDRNGAVRSGKVDLGPIEVP